MRQPKESLTKSTGRALAWNYAGSFTRAGLGFGTSIVLMRLLGPAPFGQVAVAILLFGFGNLLAGIGVGSALVQSASIDERDIRFCFTSQMIVGCAASLLLLLSAPAWATFFHQPELTRLLRFVAPMFIFQSFGTTSSAVLSRRQNTRPIQTAIVLSNAIAYLGVAIPMALLGWGVWSLVAAYLTQSLLNSVLVYLRVRHSLVPLLHRDGAKLFRFGLHVLGANLSSWGISNLDNTVVGRVAGPVALGIYSRAFSLAQMPSESIMGNLLQVLLPAFSKFQTDTKRLARVYMGAFGVAAIVLLPPFCAMAVVPGVIILGLYGTKWAGAIYLFQPLALAVPVNALMALSGPTLGARGKPRLEMKVQFAVLLVAICAFYVSVHYSVLCLSWTVLAVYLLRFAALTRVALHEIDATWVELLRASWPAILLAALAAGAAEVLNLSLPIATMWIRLAVIACGSAFVTVVVTVIFRTALLGPALKNLPQIKELMGERIRAFSTGRP